MIGYLKGKIIASNNDGVIIDVGGVGYRVFMGEYVEESKDDIELFIYTSVSERAIDLFGFQNTDDLQVFELLLNVSGVGPKSAMGILTKISGSDLLQYIALEQPEKLKASGIGKKTAEKIIVELKGKVGKMNIKVEEGPNINDIDKVIYLDVIEALSALGYKKSEIDTALTKIDMKKFDKTEDLVKQLLNLLR